MDTRHPQAPSEEGGGKNEDVNVDVDENEERGDTPKSESAPLKKEDVEHKINRHYNILRDDRK